MKNLEWINVEDELPERGEDVLICTDKGQIKISCWCGHPDTDDMASRHAHWKWWETNARMSYIG